MARVLVGLLLLCAGVGIGFYFGRSSVQKVFVPPPVSAAGDRSRAATPALPDPPIVQTGAGAPAPAATPTSARHLSLPIANLRESDILDTFEQSRGNGERRHEATDIMAPRGTPVMAVDDGEIKKLFTSKPGGLTIYQYDPTQTWCYYYAHLDRYAEGVREGMHVKRGDVIGYVGSTGNADPNAPHLHFAILELGPEKEWWRGTTPVNPYPLLIDALGKR